MPEKTTPLYVVCSPRRSVGKTLISRLLTEYEASESPGADQEDVAGGVAPNPSERALHLPRRRTAHRLDAIVAGLGWGDGIFGVWAYNPKFAPPSTIVAPKGKLRARFQF